MTRRKAHLARSVNQAGPKSLAGVFLREPGGNFGAVDSLPAGRRSWSNCISIDPRRQVMRSVAQRPMAVVLSPAAPAFKGITMTLSASKSTLLSVLVHSFC